VTWVVDWENVRTGEKGTDKLTTDVWATPTTDAIKAALQEEMAFSQGYMKAIGLEIEQSQRDVLGTSWLALLQGLDPAGGGAKFKDPGKFNKEMGKIKGYPIVIDGKYMSAKQGGAAQPAQEEKKSGGLGGALGKFAVKALKKDKPADPNEPILAYYVEVQSLAPAALDAASSRSPRLQEKRLKFGGGDGRLAPDSAHGTITSDRIVYEDGPTFKGLGGFSSDRVLVGLGTRSTCHQAPGRPRSRGSPRLARTARTGSRPWPDPATSSTSFTPKKANAVRSWNPSSSP
jgi:hypothetical protein